MVYLVSVDTVFLGGVPIPISAEGLLTWVYAFHYVLVWLLPADSSLPDQGALHQRGYCVHLKLQLCFFVGNPSQPLITLGKLFSRTSIKRFGSI